MYKIPSKRANNANQNKLSLKTFSKVNKFQKQLSINQFNLIELNEEEMNQNYETNINLLSEKEILKLKKKAALIENYFSNKSEEAVISENCFNCLMNNFKPNELLYFIKRKDLLNYLKYCFYFLNHILFLDNQIYIKNRFELDKCNDPNFLNGWRFFIPKTVCRACFLQIINSEHLIANLKTIFTDVDPNSSSRIVHKSRRRLTSRARRNSSLRRKIALKENNINTNKNGENESNKIIKDKKIKNKIKLKNNRNSVKIAKNGYSDKNGLISVKKEKLDKTGNSPKSEKSGQKSRYHINSFNYEFNHEIIEQKGDQSITEIKIKSSEFIENENEQNNNFIESITKEENKIKKNKEKESNKIIPNDINIIKQKLFSNNKILSNELLTLNSNKDYNNEINNKIKLKEINNKINMNKTNMNITKEILNIKHMYNGLVFKLHLKLKFFKELLFFTIINMEDFKEKLYNSIYFFPDIISFGISRYEQYFTSLYNEGFKAKKDYEELFTMIKNESIPSISKNISELKQEKLDDKEKKILDEFEKYLKEYSTNVDEMIKRYEDSMNNYFINFICFFNLMKELKASYSNNILNNDL